jgi:hypothetical protein
MNGPEVSASLRTFDKGPINDGQIEDRPHIHAWCVTRWYADSKAERCECNATRLIYNDGRAHSGDLP